MFETWKWWRNHPIKNYPGTGTTVWYLFGGCCRLKLYHIQSFKHGVLQGKGTQNQTFSNGMDWLKKSARCCTWITCSKPGDAGTSRKITPHGIDIDRILQPRRESCESKDPRLGQNTSDTSDFLLFGMETFWVGELLNSEADEFAGSFGKLWPHQTKPSNQPKMLGTPGLISLEKWWIALAYKPSIHNIPNIKESYRIPNQSNRTDESCIVVPAELWLTELPIAWPEALLGIPGPEFTYFVSSNMWAGNPHLKYLNVGFNAKL